MVRIRTVLYPAAVAAMMIFAWICVAGNQDRTEDEFSELFRLAQTNEQNQAYITAAELYARAAEVRDGDDEVLVLAAENFLRCDEKKMFVKYCRKAMETCRENERPWLMMGQYYLESGEAAKAAELMSQVPAECRTEESDELEDRIRSSFHKSYKSFHDVKSFYEGYCAVYDGTRWGIADENGGYCLLPEYDDAGAYNADEEIFSVCSEGRWCFVNESGQVKYAFPEKYTWLGAYNSGLVPFCCNGVYGYTDLEYRERTEKYDCAGSFNEGVAAVRRNGKWALVNPSLEQITDFEYDDIHLDRYGFCARNGIIKAVISGEEIFLDLKGNRCARRPVYSCGLTPVRFGDFFGYENESGDIAVDAYFDEVTEFSENGRAAVKEDGRWRVITLDLYRY